MRTFLLILLVFSGPVFAQDEPPSFFDFLKGLGKSDCEAFLDNGDALIDASNKAANNKDWDASFYYDDQAFHTYLKAYGHCDEEPENKQKARERLDAAKLHGNQLACLYHVTDAEAAYKRSELALEHLKSASISLKHAKESLRILESEAEKFCAFDEGRSKYVSELGGFITKAVSELQAYVDKYGDDSIEVPDVPEIP